MSHHQMGSVRECCTYLRVDYYPKQMNLLLCVCTYIQVVKCLILMLHHQLLTYRKDQNAECLTALRFGLSLLHTLSVYRPLSQLCQECDNQFVELINGMAILHSQQDTDFTEHEGL